MALVTLKELLKTNNNEQGALLRSLGNAVNDYGWDGLGGKFYSSKKYSGIDPEVKAWYDSKVGGQTPEQVEATIRAIEKPEAARTQAMIDSGQIKVTSSGAIINPDYGTSNSSGVPALGTTAYTNYLLGGNYFAENVPGNPSGQLKPFVVPTTAGQGNMGAAPLNLQGNVAGTTITSGPNGSYMAGVEAMEKAQSDNLAKQKKDLDQAQGNQNTLLNSLLGTQPDITGALAQAQEDAGLNKLKEESAKVRAEYAALNEKYVNLEAKMDAEIALAQDAMTTTGFYTRKEAAIRNKYRPEMKRLEGLMAGKTAYLAMVRGDIQDANVAVSQMVDAITAEAKWKFDTLSVLIQSNENTISRLDNNYQNALNQAYEMTKFNLQMEREEAWKKAEVLMELASQGIDASAYANKPLNELVAFASSMGTQGIDYLAKQADIRASNALANQRNSEDGGSGGNVGTDNVSSPKGLSAALQKDFNEDMLFIAGVGEGAPKNKTEASEFLRKGYSALANKYGDANFEILRAELERLYPTAPAAPAQASSGNFFTRLFSGSKAPTPTPVTSTPLLSTPAQYRSLGNLQAPSLDLTNSFMSNLFGN